MRERRTLPLTTTLLLISISCLRNDFADASAIAPSLSASAATRAASSTGAAVVAEPDASPAPTTATSTSSSNSNPLVQLLSYVKSSATNFGSGLSRMNSDHRRCNSIRAKQTLHAESLGRRRPRGPAGIQTGGISYEEYDFLKKGLVDRNKLLAVAVVMLCLPNYFVYYLWSFPDMMPSPFLRGKDAREISRERCHAVLITMLDVERGARVPPWTSKFNPFGKKATERAMDTLGSYIHEGCHWLSQHGANGPSGGRIFLQKLDKELYSSRPFAKQQIMLTAKHFPKQLMKGLSKAIAADPLNKGSSPFGVGPLKHIESVTLADEFLVHQNIDVGDIPSALLEEACSARLIGGPGWTDDERKEGLTAWLRDVEVEPKKKIESKSSRDGNDNEGGGGGDGDGDDGEVYFNGNLARAALMCYNAVDATRDGRSDSRLGRMMYQGQLM